MSYRLLFPAVLVAGSSVLAGCGGDKPAATPSATAAPSATKAAAAPALTVTDPWVKTADKGMSAAFGTLVNTTGSDITVTEGATPASPKVELHEVTGSGGQMKMRPVNGGFVIPANGRLELKPGGFHIMLMGVAKPIRPGDKVAFTLTLKDGAKVEFTALAKSFKGGNETYQPGH